MTCPFATLLARSFHVAAALVQDQRIDFAVGVLHEFDLSGKVQGEELVFGFGIDRELCLTSGLRHQLSIFHGHHQVEARAKLIRARIQRECFFVHFDGGSYFGLPVRPAVFGGNAVHHFVAELAAVIPVGHDHRAFAALFIGDEQVAESFVGAAVREVARRLRPADLHAQAPTSHAGGQHLHGSFRG